MIGKRWFGAIIGVGLLAILLFLEVLPYLGGAPSETTTPTTSPPPTAIMGALFANLPAWVNVWMHFQDIIIGATLFFVLWRKEAQIYGLAVIANHLFLFAMMPLIPIEKLSLGLPALSHFIWLIPLLVFIRAWPKLDKSTGYGTWVTIAIAQILFSLSFDIPDGIIFVMSLF